MAALHLQGMQGGRSCVRQVAAIDGGVALQNGCCEAGSGGVARQVVAL